MPTPQKMPFCAPPTDPTEVTVPAHNADIACPATKQLSLLATTVRREQLSRRRMADSRPGAGDTANVTASQRASPSYYGQAYIVRRIDLE